MFPQPLCFIFSTLYFCNNWFVCLFFFCFLFLHGKLNKQNNSRYSFPGIFCLFSFFRHLEKLREMRGLEILHSVIQDTNLRWQITMTASLKGDSTLTTNWHQIVGNSVLISNLSLKSRHDSTLEFYSDNWIVLSPIFAFKLSVYCHFGFLDVRCLPKLFHTKELLLPDNSVNCVTS